MSPSSPESRVPETIRRLGKVHHVALIVRSIDDALGLWREMLGLELESIREIEQDRVRIAFLSIGESKIELVEPTEETTGVARFLASKGEGFHHICFEVEALAFRGQESGDTSRDRKSTRLNSSHQIISYAVFCLKKKKE